MNNAEQLVETYLTLRREREKIKADYEAQDGMLKSDMEKLEAALLDICNTTNVNGLQIGRAHV